MLQITAPIKETFADGTNLFGFAGNWSIQYNDTLQRKVFASKFEDKAYISELEIFPVDYTAELYQGKRG